MLRDVVILDRARDDLEAGRDFYERRDIGVGDYFIESLLSDIAALAFHYGEPKMYFGLCRRLAKKFPFAVYYQLDGDSV